MQGILHQSSMLPLMTSIGAATVRERVPDPLKYDRRTLLTDHRVQILTIRHPIRNQFNRLRDCRSHRAADRDLKR